MNFTDPRFYLDVAVIIFSVINVLVTWLRKPGEDAVAGLATLRDHVDTQHKAIAGDVATLRRHVDDQHQAVHNNLAVLGERIAHMPTSEELAELAGSVKALAASQEALASAQDRMSQSLTRIENYLLNNK
jgi:hypothetical protein